MTVQLGSNGAEVTAVQQMLSDLNFPLAVDGHFGPSTDEAVRGFQLVTGLVVDGVVGPTTLAALNNGAWNDVADNALVALPQLRRQLTESISTQITVSTFEADVRWYNVFESNFYETGALNTKLDVMAGSWISTMKAQAQTVGPGAGANFVNGELAATLIAPSLASAAGQLSEFVSGAAHPNPRIVTVTMDLAANKTIAGPDLFIAGSSWPQVLRGIVSFFGIDPADVVSPTRANFSKVALTPDGVNLYLLPEQVGLPLAAGVQTYFCPWVKIESVIRPSVLARSLGGSAGGSGPHVD
jgi:peptidoglycan hydrolase-like protein with peptidoglycan-binding domain